MNVIPYKLFEPMTTSSLQWYKHFESSCQASSVSIVLRSSDPTGSPIPHTAPFLWVRMVHKSFGRGRRTVQNTNGKIFKRKKACEKAKNMVSGPDKDRYEDRWEKERNKGGKKRRQVRWYNSQRKEWYVTPFGGERKNSRETTPKYFKNSQLS